MSRTGDHYLQTEDDLRAKAETGEGRDVIRRAAMMDLARYPAGEGLSWADTVLVLLSMVEEQQDVIAELADPE